MGLSIYYKGKFWEKACLVRMIDEIKDIAEICKWEYAVYKEQFPKHETPEMVHDGEVYGITFTPPECETISICFLSNRRMSSPVHLNMGTHNKQISGLTVCCSKIPNAAYTNRFIIN